MITIIAENKNMAGKVVYNAELVLVGDIRVGERGIYSCGFRVCEIGVELPLDVFRSQLRHYSHILFGRVHRGKVACENTEQHYNKQGTKRKHQRELDYSPAYGCLFHIVHLN